MTIDERLEALTRNLQVMAIESEKRDKQIAQLATVCLRLLRDCEIVWREPKLATTMNGQRPTTDD